MKLTFQEVDKRTTKFVVQMNQMMWAAWEAYQKTGEPRFAQVSLNAANVILGIWNATNQNHALRTVLYDLAGHAYTIRGQVRDIGLAANPDDDLTAGTLLTRAEKWMLECQRTVLKAMEIADNPDKPVQQRIDMVDLSVWVSKIGKAIAGAVKNDSLKGYFGAIINRAKTMKPRLVRLRGTQETKGVIRRSTLPASLRSPEAVASLTDPVKALARRKRGR